ncbi:MAG TPA: hypothetical protein VK483_16315 [Chitinophagaceae bacterium]|nr:hypothetical protein [Chitinophagaceae bacterium]
MQIKLHFRQSIYSLLLIVCFLFPDNNSQAQSRQADIKEMKDTINQIVSRVKSLEKETTPDKKQVDDLRTKVMVLLILNSNRECGVWPSPSSKIELIEDYWKCLFDKAPYGKKFILE